ncbi:EutN/CcmL family microcompartment protein [Streptococcus massiliensis]|uniref:Putative ethanolamine utilization protein EutN/carboxysome structural protein Ccml n=1 Tax=Streptococcus massiliensis TaxID=313439 RepID=A0A380L0A1_9STRE|nr:EutN/CcmL family microcompartment protein [Streptococcus massiliensis]SUN77242.1 putative ethanolamine utilization protein EutN/carboxysome structural protein Ccml [Streptococcus massiliensis]
MYIGQVIGNVVSTKKNDYLTGNRFLIINLLAKNGENQIIETGRQLVAVDEIGAGRGEYVLISTGSAARKALANPKSPVDASIVGIIDDFIE